MKIHIVKSPSYETIFLDGRPITQDQSPSSESLLRLVAGSDNFSIEYCSTEEEYRAVVESLITSHMKSLELSEDVRRIGVEYLQWEKHYLKVMNGLEDKMSRSYNKLYEACKAAGLGTKSSDIRNVLVKLKGELND